MNRITNLLSLVFLTTVVACGGSQTDINRVQPNITHKALFEGEWYMGSIIAEKQYANSWIFEGAQDELKIIRWEITEDTLYGYLSYEQVIGTDGPITGEHRVAVAFPIESHFDIRREYNAQTGRENNVIVENTNDRPWWERDYIRVDWGTYGGPSGFYLTTYGSMVNAIRAGSIKRNVDDNPLNPYRARVEKDYIETSIHSILEPDSGACAMTGYYNDCEPTEAKIKYSFWKVPEKKTYAPQSYKDAEGKLGFVYDSFSNLPVTDRFGSSQLCQSNDDVLNIAECNTSSGNFCECRLGEVWQSTEFAAGLCDPELNDIDSCYQAAIDKWSSHGFFRTARHFYDRERGSTVSGREYFVQRFNIWEDAYSDDGTGVVRSLITGAAVTDDSELIECEQGDDLSDIEVSRRTVRVDREDNGDQTRYYEVFTCGERVIVEDSCESTDEGLDCEEVDRDVRETYPVGSCHCDTTLDYADRTPKTINYYLNAGFPDYMMDSVEPIESEWNTVFMNAIAAGQGKTVEEVAEEYGSDDTDFAAFKINVNSCNPTNIRSYIDMYPELEIESLLSEQGVSVEDEDLGIGNMEQVCALLEYAGIKYLRDRGVVLRPNDDGVMEYFSFLGEEFDENGFGPGKLFKWEQLGNVKYNFLNWVHKPEVAGPLGYGPSFADPRTGENISATANMYGASLLTYSVWAGDVVDFVNGNLDIGDIQNGSHIREYFEQVRRRDADFDADAIGKAFMMRHDRELGTGGDYADIPRIPVSGVGETMRRLNETYAGTSDIEAYNFEDEFLVTADMEYLFGNGLPEYAGRTEADQRIASRPSSWMGREVPNQLAQLVTHGAFDSNQLLTIDGGRPSSFEEHKHSDMFYSTRNYCFFGPDVEPGVASLAARLASEGATRDEVEKLIMKNIMIGVSAHEIGHNVGLRHNFSGSVDALNFFPEWWGVDGSDYLKKRYDRSGSDLDLEEGGFDRDELAYSTIMDYHQEFNSDWGGLGPYDQASVMMGYVDMVEIFDEDENANGIVEEDEEIMPRELFLGWVNYNDFPYMLSGGRENIDLLNVEFERALDSRRVGVDDALFEPSRSGVEPRPENIYKRKYIPFNEYLSNISNYERVPYEFCTDQFAGGINVRCQVWDKGVSMTEIVQNYKKMYDVYQPFYTYLGSKSGDPTNSWLNRLYSRTLERVLNTYQWFYFYRRGFARVFPFVHDYASAAHVGLNFIASILQAPEPGTYCLEDGMYVHASEATGGCGTAIEVNGLFGRPLQTSYIDQKEGYLPQYVGHMYDKIAALNALTSSEGFLYGSLAEDVSPGAFSIGYYRTFHEELEKLLIEHITGEFDQNMYRVMDDGEIVPTPLVVYDDEIRSAFPENNDFGFGDDANYDADGNFIMGGTPIKPSHNYYMKIYSLSYSLIGYTSIYDESLDMAERSEITIVGSFNDPVRVGDGFEEVRFTDPWTGTIYRAYDFADGRGNIAATLLRDAQDFIDSDEYQNASSDAERLRVDSLLQDKIGLIDYVRYMTKMMEFSQN